MRRSLKSIVMSATMALLTLLVLAACSSDDLAVGDISAAPDQLTKEVAWDETEASITFAANADWTATVEEVATRAATSISWLKLTVPKGEAGDVTMPLLMTKNDNDTYREAIVTLHCGEKTVKITIHQNANPDAVHVMDPEKIANYDKFYCPGNWNEGFEKGSDYMLRSDARWSWWRMKQSEHFFVFWEPGFGDNPNADSVPKNLRVDVDDLLQKAEQFYKTNVEKLGMATVGQGKSVLDHYKMEIYLLYQTEWLATGSGYDDKIGALWVNPSTCKPVGSTIGHEIGHSFQYQVSADKIFNGEGEKTDYGANVGFRYGYGENGKGGCPYWEQCAQWQSFQDYPQEAFTQDANVQVWLKNHHRSFLHEWQRYASYWFQYYFTQKHGLEAYARIWRESKFPEDPLQTYMRLYCGNRLDNLYKDMFNFAQRCADYDFDAVHQYKTEAAVNYGTKLVKTGSGASYQVAYENCPGTTGFNLVKLNVPAAGTKVSIKFEGLTPGAALAKGDNGQIVDGDGKAKGTATHYNTQANHNENFRYGFVAVDKSGKSHYGEMHQGKSSTASFTTPAGTERLYFVVLGAPDTYNRQAWDDDETNDEQWPYAFTVSGTDVDDAYVSVNVDVDPAAKPKNVSLNIKTVGTTSASYEFKHYNLAYLDNAAICHAFSLTPAQLAERIVSQAKEPQEGKIVFRLHQPDGTYSYTDNCGGEIVGFWCDGNGKQQDWGEKARTYTKFHSLYDCEVGFMPGTLKSGDNYKEVVEMVYRKDGKDYIATLNFNFSVQ
ncbi:DUF6055 domain-containing protein [Hallella absiana]|uniref:DUF6055 domain-containing protein n=1 Tax=Hallella absiana TaxID=2925336 RepID=UPI0021C6C216|nr:DUF6055 domain-containing protein [Hallella absiana]